MRHRRLRTGSSAIRLSIILAASLASLPSLADDAARPECSYFRGMRGLTVGGGASNTPVIPVAIDELTIDLVEGRACHTLRWSIYTVKSVSQEKVCFDIGGQAKEKKVAVSAKFPTGVTAKVAELSAFEDRAIARNLAETCRMRPGRPSGGRAPQGGIDL